MFAPRCLPVLMLTGVLALPGGVWAVDESRANEMTIRVDRFLQSLAESTATAKSRSNRDVKFIALGVDGTNQITISRLGVGKGHSAGYCKGEHVIAVAHVHHRLMTQGPEPADFQVASAGQSQPPSAPIGLKF